MLINIMIVLFLVLCQVIRELLLFLDVLNLLRLVAIFNQKNILIIYLLWNGTILVLIHIIFIIYALDFIITFSFIDYIKVKAHTITLILRQTLFIEIQTHQLRVRLLWHSLTISILTQPITYYGIVFLIYYGYCTLFIISIILL